MEEYKMEKSNEKSKWYILIVVVMFTFMSTLDGSIVNVALPKMAESLGVTTSNIQLVATSYLIAIAGTILIFGKLGDMFGKTKIFKFGIALFTLGSFLCGATSSFSVLILARIIQAIGAAGTMANSQGIITEVFPPYERGKALGLVGTFVALGSLVGPGLGGIIVGATGWEYIFLINVPIGVVVLGLSFKLFPKNHHENQPDERLDVMGALLFMFTIVPLFLSLNEGLKYGFTNPFILTGFTIAVLSFLAFILVEKRRKYPLIQLEMFDNKLFTLSIFCGFISFVAIFCSNIILPFYLQNVRSYTPQHAGLLLMVYPLILTVVAPFGGSLSDKIGSEILTFIGLLFTSVGLFMMSTLNENTSLITMILFIATMSVGNGLFQSPNNSLVMSTVARDKLGIAGSINALIRNLGMVCGIALSTTLLYSMMSAKIGYRVTDYVVGRSDVFIYGMKVVYITAGIISLFGAILTFLRLRKKDIEVSDTI
jgi:EmrB/QacA subfamily drug resistance transporter